MNNGIIMKILFENRYIRIGLSERFHCLEYHWKESTTNRSLKILLNKVSYFAELYNCNKLIPDLDNIINLPDEMRFWAESEWFPNLVKIGIRTFLIVNSDSMLTMNSINDSKNFILNLKNNISIRTIYFSDLNTAMDWLELDQI